MSDVQLETLRVLADNPADIDLLGLAGIARAVRDIVCSESPEPVTVGLHGPWGSGKSSLLRQVDAELRSAPKTIVFELNPWEFADDEDVKGTIIATVLTELANEIDPKFLDRLKALAHRVGLKRAAKMITNGALALGGEPVAALNLAADLMTVMPTGDNEIAIPTNLTGFRTEFAELMSEVDVNRVVVLVDDLDRCLPSAVLATLEAMKLFLAVPKMAFVVAADQQMVRESIAAGLGETQRSALFARDYLDKIVQVPITVPQPTKDDAEAYMALILAHRTAGGAIDLEALSQHAEDRRLTGELPYLAHVSDGSITHQHMSEAKLIVTGLGADDVVNPRRMKRFVNALAVRNHTAASSGVNLDPALMAKLFMLEHRFLPQMTELASLSDTVRTERLESWEAWAGEEDGEGGTPPGQPEDDLRTFFAAEPRLSQGDVDRYFVLARKLLKTNYVGGLNEAALAVLGALTNAEPAQSLKGKEQIGTLAPEQASLVADELVAQLATSSDPSAAFRGLIMTAAAGVETEKSITAIRSRKADIEPAVASVLTRETSNQLVQLAAELAADQEVDGRTRRVLGR